MSARPFNWLVLGMVTVLLGNSVAIAQTNSSSRAPVVVPTDGTSPTNSPDTTIPTGSSNRFPTTNIPTGSSTTTPNDGIARFSCQLANNQWTVMYQPQSQPNQYFAWAAPKQLGGGWTAQRRCQEISRRLEAYRPDGLQELRNDITNNYNTICVTTQRIPACQLVLTIPPGQDPVTTRNQIFQNLLTADSGQDTQAVNTYADNGKNSGLNSLLNLGRSVIGGNRNQQVTASSGGINLRPFLAPEDGGTGSKLNSLASIRTNRPSNTRLNPNKFR